MRDAMNDFLQASQLRDEARRLLRYRVPVIVAVLCNFALLIRFPLVHSYSQTQSAPPSPAATAQAVPGPSPPPAASAVDPPPPHAALAVSSAAAPTAAAGPEFDVAQASRQLADTAQRLGVRIATSRWAQTLGASLARSSDESQQERSAPTPAPSIHPSLVLRNRSDNGGSVTFLVNGRRCELGPGEAHEFAADQPGWQIQFHRGDAFGNEERTLTKGRYEFIVTDQGWALETCP